MKKKLLNYNEIPKWQQTNEYIISGYRHLSGSVSGSLKSLFNLHNESVNMWTHFVGMGIFEIIHSHYFSKLGQSYPTIGWLDSVLFVALVQGMAICFLCSAMCHTLWNHSTSYAAGSAKMDFVGIVIFMWGSMMSTIYYGFWCNSRLQLAYCTAISILAISCCIATLDENFSRPGFRYYRVAMYGSVVPAAVIFVTHGILLYGFEEQKKRMALVPLALMAFLNLVGGFFYASRIPEKWYPFKYDIFGSSHQIFHILVVCAGLAHFFGLQEAFKYTHSTGYQCN